MGRNPTDGHIRLGGTKGQVRTITIKLHIFRWTAEPHINFRAGQKIGHLYSDLEDIEELHQAAASIGIPETWFQAHGRLCHYDLWGYKLTLAARRFRIVTNREFVKDMKGKP